MDLPILLIIIIVLALIFDYINGFLLRRARAHGIAVPENTRLFEMVKRKESEYERIGTGLPRPW